MSDEQVGLQIAIEPGQFRCLLRGKGPPGEPPQSSVQGHAVGGILRGDDLDVQHAVAVEVLRRASDHRQTVLAAGDGDRIDAAGADAAVDEDVHQSAAGFRPRRLAHGNRDRSPCALGHANPVLQVSRLAAQDAPQFRAELRPKLKPVAIRGRVRPVHRPGCAGRHGKRGVLARCQATCRETQEQRRKNH